MIKQGMKECVRDTEGENGGDEWAQAEVESTAGRVNS